MSDKTRGKNWRIEISENLCKGCEICIEFCPLECFGNSEKLNRKGYFLPVVINEDKCSGCRICELLCPELAIIITEKQKPVGQE